METLIELAKFLQTYKEENIYTFLNEGTEQEKGYNQEGIAKIFAGLRSIDKLKNYDLCKGNFNKKTITKNTSYRDVFYNEKNNLINFRGNKGDSSDLTCISKSNDKHLLVTTSKNLNKTTRWISWILIKY